MERLLAEICQEATKESEIQAQCTALLGKLCCDRMNAAVYFLALVNHPNHHELSRPPGH